MSNALSVIIDYFDVFRTIATRGPFKANAPLLVDPYAELAFAIAGEGFKPVAGQSCQVPETRCCVKYSEALFSLAAESIELRDVLSVGKLPGSPIAIAEDHLSIIR